ncbi:DNA packaging protein UL32 [Testudinid alphaherpesvirus 3]|uniref:Packaging protein UL32 n=1 Tax=Testudinid alphaherpesvirus 3 TaxID=2560801 RepID=A0A0K1R1B6_9ALPH|nr:DNA packaging protein UL32 [Testudinid alphaherpesvirus 3]AIU39263.1 DNA packaging protein UL32 [Testudinid alphaherpesvirus 3]AIU39373.1 DNA packaging protein UL32 [Testudinid alphaherpesvirus 3]AKI81649.1 DNA packaging protein UL32 [Testudinid alphaherpesvirus 3]AKI81752.1 DNA packaging protein UL32 [Testudinid alphaherpesvirus 3]AKV40704.1 UL32 cleavage/packaging protein [Testudinid alphaherpesvirus 3]
MFEEQAIQEDSDLYNTVSSWRDTKRNIESLKYNGFEPRLLSGNDQLRSEVLYSSYPLDLVPPNLGESSDPFDAAAESGIGPDPEPFLELVSETFAIDSECRICSMLELFRKARVQKVEWFLDYIALCRKCLAAPLCATSTFITAFEFAYIMEKHYSEQDGITVIGVYSNRMISVNDIQKHFYIHCCFKTNDGVVGKILYSNYSFLMQSIIKSVMFIPFPKHPNSGKDVMVQGWKTTATTVDCMKRYKTTQSCYSMASTKNEAYAKTCHLGDSPQLFAYSDLIVYLLGGTNALPIKAEAMSRIKNFRDQDAIERYHNANRGDVREPFKKFLYNGELVLDNGPELLSFFKHSQSKNGTSTECVACNMMLIKQYWYCLRVLREDISHHSTNNVSLYDCIEPVICTWLEEDRFRTLTGRCDRGRFYKLITSVNPAVLYKHFFCDPVCALNRQRVNPEVLFDNVDDLSLDDLQLQKAMFAHDNKFDDRICPGVWAAAFAFKYYQLHPPKNTVLNALIKDVTSSFKRHNINLVSLEHTLSRYV